MDRRSFLRIAAGAGAGAGLGLHASFVEPRRVEVTRHLVGGPGGGRVPLVVAQVSDLHLRSLSSLHHAIAHLVNAEQPDLVLLTGDSVDRAHGLDALDAFLALLSPAVPRLAIPGNWEYWGRVDLGEMAALLERRNGRLLVNETAVHPHRGRRLTVTGLDDWLAGGPDVARALRGVEPSDAHLLLAHCPEHRDRLAEAATEASSAGIRVRESVDLTAYRFAAVLSGHTHGGQVCLGGWVPLLPPGSGGYVGGWYRGDGVPPMYVSRGLGTSVLPIRLGVSPEVAVFTVWV